MWILDSKYKSIQAKTTATPTTALDFSCAYITKNDSKENPHCEEGTLTESYIDVITPPAENISKEVLCITVHNNDNITHTITFILKKNINSTSIINTTLYKCILQSGWTAEWQEKTGWIIYTELGIRF